MKLTLKKTQHAQTRMNYFFIATVVSNGRHKQQQIIQTSLFPKLVLQKDKMLSLWATDLIKNK